MPVYFGKYFFEKFMTEHAKAVMNDESSFKYNFGYSSQKRIFWCLKKFSIKSKMFKN